MSADGSEIAFDSIDSAINPTPSLFQTFAKDLDTGKITFLSRNKHGRPGNGFSYFPSVNDTLPFPPSETGANNTYRYRLSSQTHILTMGLAYKF